MAKYNPKNPNRYRKTKSGKPTRILKRGLTTKEKSEVKEIAKKTINVVAEKKFMNTQPSYNVVPLVSKAGGSRVSVLGFVNTINAVGTGLNQIELNYGIEDQASDPVVGVPMRELKMLRPFTGTTGNNQLDNYAITGRECMPVSASCKWRLSRDIGKLISGLETGDNWNTNLGAPNGLQHNLPILCRMIRVCPKLTQLNQTCDPEQDLFVSPYNNAIGVAVGAFDEFELMTYPINRRRYNVIADTKFKIQNGLTVSYQRATFRDESDNFSDAMLQPFISNTNSNCEKLLSTSHILTAKKGKPVFYDTPFLSSPAVETSTAGSKKEYILYHFMYMGAETYLDNEGVVAKAPTDLKVSAQPTVKFTDV